MRIPILSHQEKFIYSEAKHTALIGGFGSGKSISGTIKAIKIMCDNNTDIAYYLPTYPLIKKIAYKNFKHYLNLFGIKYELNRSDHIIYTDFGQIIFQSMDRPENIIGYEVGYSVIDEVDTIPLNKMQELLVAIIARNRLPIKHKYGNMLDFVSTPEGFGFLYDFVEKKKKAKVIRAKTMDNPFLPDDYIENLLNIYSEQQIQAYLNGEFVNLTSGMVYYNFDRSENHSDREVKETDVLHIGMDFNITNMSAVVYVTDSDLMTAVDEIVDVYDTPQMIDLLKSNYPNNRIVVYPDASSQARKTVGSSDLQLLKRARFNVRILKSNPNVKDRVTVMNTSFKNSEGVTKHFINTNNCPSYTESLERQAYDKNGTPDKQNGFDHLNDAGGYAVFGLISKMKRKMIVRSS